MTAASFEIKEDDNNIAIYLKRLSRIYIVFVILWVMKIWSKDDRVLKYVSSLW